MPPSALPTTGTPRARASSTTIGWFSYQRDGTATTDAAGNFSVGAPALSGVYVEPLACVLRAQGKLAEASARFARTLELLPQLLTQFSAIADTLISLLPALGEALTETNDPPVKAMIVYNSNPGSVAPDRQTVLRGLRRDDLFTVVLEHFQTDTADYADVLLPATTQLEHDDLHKAYGHLYMMYNRRAIEPLGEALPNSEIFRRLAASMHVDFPELKASDEELMRDALTGSGMTLEDLRERSWIRVNVPSPHMPFRSGVRLTTKSGKIEIDSPSVGIPEYVPPYESEERDPDHARRFPLALISPPAHEFLNSSFVNVASLRRSAGKPTLEIHADDARERSIAAGQHVTIFNERGRFTAEAVITDRVRPGVVSAPSIWWGKFTDDGCNANQTTSQALTDIGGGATFYDNLVEVRAGR